MTWIWPDRIVPPVVKHKGNCWKHSQQKICPYFLAQHRKTNKNVIKYKCSLFDEDIVGGRAVSDCNSTYGQSYDGPP